MSVYRIFPLICLVLIIIAHFFFESSSQLSAFLKGRGVPSDTNPPPPPPRRRLRPRHVQRLLYLDKSCAQKPEFVRHLGGNAVVVDVGAHHGEELGGYKGLVSRIYAFEPGPTKLENIRKAVAAAGMDDVVSITHAGVSNKSGFATFHQDSQSGGSQQDSFGLIGLGHKYGDILVPIVVLDEVLNEHIDLLKIDVQGHELNVLEGAKRLMVEKGVDMLHIEFSPSFFIAQNYTGYDLLDFLYQMEYTCFACDTGESFGPSELRPSVGEPWGFTEFTAGFKLWEGLRLIGHGTWADLVCV